MSSERFPIDFDNIWEKAGYKNRKHAVDAFKACVQNFNLTEGLEFSRKSGEINIGPGRPRQSFDMTIGAAIDWPYWDTNHFHLSHGINMWNRL